ncbi:hypothetical protein RAB80_005090 [Fusarium oxysporum f. sp. vasinfectum]|nr:hypothetical protein RAB80_005090 [Fusarium oxysporum f. sp. vasinfectum]
MPVQPHIGATALLSVMDREILASNSVAHLHTIRDPHLQEGPDQTAYRPPPARNGRQASYSRSPSPPRRGAKKSLSPVPPKRRRYSDSVSRSPPPMKRGRRGS